MQFGIYHNVRFNKQIDHFLVLDLEYGAVPTCFMFDGILKILGTSFRYLEQDSYTLDMKLYQCCTYKRSMHLSRIHAHLCFVV